MDHPNTRILARYALGDITDEAELAAFEDHLLECAECRRRALAVDLIGTMPPEEENGVVLHISGGEQEHPLALCGDTTARNIVSPILVSGLDRSVVCPQCLALLHGGSAAPNQHLN